MSGIDQGSEESPGQAYPQTEHSPDEPDKKREARFKKALIPSINECLEGWQADQETKHWPAWAWRVVFQSLDEVDRILQEK